jgi:HAD superfamily hydrolase (TIGR01509 family)
MKYKCIIFDCDGVLVDSEEISIGLLIEMANTVGVAIEKKYALENFSGKSLKSCLEYIESQLNGKLPATFEQEFRNRSFAMFETDLKPIPGIHDLLCKIEIPFCVASSGPLEKIRLNLTATNLIDRFNGNIFSSYEINSWKPDPEIFLYSAKKMGFKVADCVVIEDSIAGVRAAKKGGFDVIAFVSDGNRERFKDENIKICYDMSELMTLLK